MTIVNVIELRQYTLHPGERDELIELFDRELVEPQESAGMAVLGQFRDEDDPDRFVWLRGFPSMAARRESLTAFYLHGDAWRANRSAANATMKDSSDVLLLRPSRPGPLVPPGAGRPPIGVTTPPGSRVTITLCHLGTAVDEDFVRFFEEKVHPALAATGASPIVCLRTERAANTFPALPVRTGENVFLWLTVFANEDHREEHRRRLAESPGWRAGILPELRGRLSAPPRHLRLAPTARSRLR
ncbi:NIPSNAP family protein [Amycolatopsis cynarae]|uniref:NIPSNAP family protein n=1 Tax=Amycolatopsis cynarae TaxID=2995223 RepID=A0ABY7B5B4_9PSEU|nr:NIPSNAP family protein [Amycolatopsis sp. HUAS 11-8]WAL66843.1 NIPSNAP family protein [Amycolatopsis sp. HUAS 11-8]